MKGRSRRKENPLRATDPLKDLLAGSHVIRTRHLVPRSVPKSRACHNDGHSEILHGVRRIAAFVPVPGVVENPGCLFLSKGAKGYHPHLIKEPVELSASGSQGFAVLEVVLVGNRVHGRVQAIDVSSETYCWVFNFWINLDDYIYLQIDRSCLLSYIAMHCF